MSIRPIQPIQEQEEIVYPESDGKPMADNTEQFDWIVTIKNGLEELFMANPNVFIAGDLLWYPVEGSPKIRAAPDAMVAFGRPKGPRGSYRQWLEGNIAPQVVFEILSPGNKPPEMETKRRFYQLYDVEEYYIYDPDSYSLSGWIRTGIVLTQIAQMRGWVSPLLGIKFELNGPNGELQIYYPDGRPFTRYLEVVVQRNQERARAEQERTRAEQERTRAELAEQRVKQERDEKEWERERAEQERQNMVNLLARLKAKGIELDEL
ncbi:MAG: Uma2 family endonuclease [Chloroflexi bacterium]|nr:Uma2 family endonuclease [Chloroflexota bacterium]